MGWILILVALFVGQNLTAQTSDREKVRSRFQGLSEEALQQPSQLELDIQMQALETAVDPNTYIVGPGDQFLINIWSSMESNFTTPVTPEGKLIIPTVGTLQVDGKTLSEVQTMVKEAGSKKYIQSVIMANLVRLRTFRVHVTGQVQEPGTYTSLATYRVSDIIDQAGGLTNWSYERAIRVRHTDGTVDTVDLYKYKKLGDLDTNIHMRGGDLIFVPSVELTDATIRLEAEGTESGTYQLASDESLTDFLLRVKALNRRADLSSAYVERKSATDGGPEVIPLYPYLEGTGNGHSQLNLKDGDVIRVPQQREVIYVIGAVLRPGQYPYIPDLKARDYVGWAGSTERAVNLEKTKVIRNDGETKEEGENLDVGPGDTVFVPERVRFGVLEAVTVVGQMTSILIALKAVGVY